MAKGKATGEFSLKTTSISVSAGPAGSTIVQCNLEGTATGLGAIIATAAFVGGKNGTFSYHGAAYLDNGDTASATGNGTYESIGIHRWRTVGFLQTSLGGAIITEGEIDFATRSWTGKVFENS